MTEEEARAKWCPFVRYVDFGGQEGIIGLNGYKGNAPNCIGSACMAWRWTKVPNPDWKPQSMVSSFPDTTNPYNRVDAGMNSKTDGYCGLAGRL